MKTLVHRSFRYWRLASAKVKAEFVSRGFVSQKCAGVGEGW